MPGSPLKAWVERRQREIEGRGYQVRYHAHDQGQCSVDIDGKKVVGTITHWPENSYEIQFNDCQSGGVLLLVTEELRDPDSLIDYLEPLGILSRPLSSDQ